MYMRVSHPGKIVEDLPLRVGMRVVDFGVGSGFYIERSLQKVGEAGRVYAVDVQADLLIRTKNEMQEKGSYNLQIIQGDLEKPLSTKLRDALADAVILSNVLFQVKDKRAVVAEAARITKPGGFILCVDWEESLQGVGPKPEQVIEKDAILTLLQDEGFTYEREIEAGSHHYGIIGRRQ